MPIFDTFDRTGTAEFAYPREVVVAAVQHAASTLKGMKVQEASPSAGFITIKTGISAMSWGEIVKVSVTSAGPWMSRLTVASAGKTIAGSALTHGKNQKNISTLVRATATTLDRYGRAWVEELGFTTKASGESAGGASVADELRKLAELRDQGILSQDEFVQQKARLLGT